MLTDDGAVDRLIYMTTTKSQKLTAAQKNLLAAYGFAVPAERRPAKDRYEVVSYLAGRVATRTPVATLTQAREMASRASRHTEVELAALGSYSEECGADILILGKTDAALESYQDGRRVA